MATLFSILGVAGIFTGFLLAIRGIHRPARKVSNREFIARRALPAPKPDWADNSFTTMPMVTGDSRLPEGAFYL